MPLPEPPLASNNPFRRKPGNPFPATGPHVEDSPAAYPPPPHPPPLGLPFSLDTPFDPAPRPPPFTTFKSAMPESERRDEEEKPIQPKPRKIVKKVRVQSPPPSSPEDSVPVTRFPPRDSDDDDDDDDDEDNGYRDEGDDSSSDDSNDDVRGGLRGDVDPFNTTPPGTRNKAVVGPPLPRAPPPNPFSRTLQDVAPGQDIHEPSMGTTKGSLDVNSFKQLLLTGHAETPGQDPKPETGGKPVVSPTTKPPSAGNHDGASSTDTSSISRQSVLEPTQETPRTSHETSEPDEDRRGVLPSSPLANVQSTSGRKKPPPPSSRHGKLIKIELGTDSTAAATRNTTPPKPLDTSSRRSSSYGNTPQSSPPLPKDVNKPLPQPPFRPPADEDVDSPFDREAAGKVPETFTNLQSNSSSLTPPVTIVRNRSESQGSAQLRKPVAPPPRRHGRSDSRAPSINTVNTDDDPPRSSLDSDRSRPDSLRGNIKPDKSQSAPIPPPPRRPQHGRQGSSFANPTRGTSSPRPVTSPVLGGRDDIVARTPLNLAGGGVQMENPSALATVTTSKDGLTKLSPPPPPPTRQASTRRPHSSRGVEGGLGNGGPGSVRRVSREKDGAAAPPPPPPPRLRGGSRTSTDPPPGTESTKHPGDQVKPAALQETSISGQVPAASDSQQGVDILADLDALQREVDALMGRYPTKDS
ncbi:hypothetical protein F5X96DRAFT_180112 [Biscogniauxia mediterranea]|nr:hypothetical protein F5X96DRAFT_180112 [Biscogniauxia mediterranea]